MSKVTVTLKPNGRPPKCACGACRACLLRASALVEWGAVPLDDVASPMPVADLAWAAGLFEGEGSIRISKPAKRNMGSLCADVPNCDKAIPAFYLARWGGSVSHYVVDDEVHRPVWRWRVSSRVAAQFLRDVLPYLRTSRYIERAMLGLEFQAQKSGGGRCTDPTYASRQVEFYERMARLNLRGVRDRA